MKRRIPDEIVTGTGTLFAGQSAAEKIVPSASANSPAAVVIRLSEKRDELLSSSSK